MDHFDSTYGRHECGLAVVRIRVARLKGADMKPSKVTVI